MKSLSGPKAFYTYESFPSTPSRRGADIPYATTERDQFEIDYAGYPGILEQGYEASVLPKPRAETGETHLRLVGTTALVSEVDHAA